MTDSEQGGAQGQTSFLKMVIVQHTHTHALFSAQCPQGDLEIHFLCFVHTQIVSPFSGCAFVCVQSSQRKKRHYDNQSPLRPLTEQIQSSPLPRRLCFHTHWLVCFSVCLQDFFLKVDKAWEEEQLGAIDLGSIWIGSWKSFRL